MESFAELVREALPEHARGKPVEVDQDEARVGQQGTLTRVWARRGTRPRAPRDRRYAWAYLFGAVCPERAVGAALVLPYADTEATGLHLAEVGREVAPGRTRWSARRRGLARGGRPRRPREPHPATAAVLLAEFEPGRERLGVPAPEQAQPSRLADYEAIVATCCEAWNWLVAAPDRLASITAASGRKRSPIKAVGMRLSRQ